MSMSGTKNIGAYISHALAGTALVNITAGSTNNGTNVTGTQVDLHQGLTSGYDQPGSCVVTIPFKATMVNGNTLNISGYLQTGPTASGAWTNVAVLAAATAISALANNAAQTGTFDFDVDLSSAQQYIQMIYAGTLSASGTDTATLYPPVYTFAGQPELPSGALHF